MKKYVLGLRYSNPTPNTFQFLGCSSTVDGAIFGSLSMDVREAEPPHPGEYYTISAFNLKGVPCSGDYALNLGEFYRHLLIFDVYDLDRIYNFLYLLMSKCASVGDIWRTFMQYAASEDEGYIIWQVLYDKKKIVGIEPSFTWRFEEGRSIEPLQEMYDERIVIELSWIFEGTQYSFKGYWYVASIAFIEEQMKTHDPYYRRFILLMKTFNADEVTRLIQKEVDYLALLDHSERESYIFYHFEHEGLTMFYER